MSDSIDGLVVHPEAPMEVIVVLVLPRAVTAGRHHILDTVTGQLRDVLGVPGRFRSFGLMGYDGQRDKREQ
jgi:hypothetical protein